MTIIRIAACLSIALTTLAACTSDTPAVPEPGSAAQWSCSPDAESRYHIGPDGMTLEVCSAGCADRAKGAVCGG